MKILLLFGLALLLQISLFHSTFSWSLLKYLYIMILHFPLWTTNWAENFSSTPNFLEGPSKTRHIHGLETHVFHIIHVDPLHPQPVIFQRKSFNTATLFHTVMSFRYHPPQLLGRHIFPQETRDFFWSMHPTNPKKVSGNIMNLPYHYFRHNKDVAPIQLHTKENWSH